MNLVLSDHQVRMLRLRAQRLAPRGAGRPVSVDQVLTDVCGVQAQELPAALVSVHARGVGLAAADIEQERMKARTIVRTWCMRGTLHLVTAEDARWLVPLFGPVIIASDRRRMVQLGWDEERTSTGLRLVRDEMARLGGLTREEIIRLLRANGLPNEGQAPVHLIARAASEGMLCQGPDRGKKPTYMPFTDWVGELCLFPRAAALAELAHRYLEAYAPASPADLASWSGLKMSEVRQAWQAIGNQLVPVENPGQTLWLLKSQLDWVEPGQDYSPVVRLLPKFDTYLLGYAKRDLLVPPTFAKYIHPGGGLISQILMVDGRGLGIWTARLRGSVLVVTVKSFERLAGELLQPIELEAASLGQFMGVAAVLKIEGLE